MKRSWLYYFPALFLPNLGFGLTTEYGTLELSDLLIGPYLILVSPALNLKRRTLIDRLIPPALVFTLWALANTLMIGAKYQYDNPYYTVFSLLKLGKLVLYGLAGLLTVKALDNLGVRRAFATSLVVAGLVVGLALIAVGSKTTQASLVAFTGYKASNGISVMAAILASYLAGLWLRPTTLNHTTRRLAPLAVAVLLCGSLVSEGRGGWVAATAGFTYLCCRTGVRARNFAIIMAVPLIAYLVYTNSPVVRSRVDMTTHPDIGPLKPGICGIDDGSRPDAWLQGLDQFHSPVSGTGFFHRGGHSGLVPTGSHNFFLQMFLETGILGGTLILALFYGMWLQAASPVARLANLEVPVKGALVAAFVGGLSGEYFYGGVIPFSLIAACASCGSLSATPTFGIDCPILHARDHYAQGARSR